MGLVEGRIPGIRLAEDDRQPLGWRDQLGGAGHSEEEVLQLVIPQRARWSIRIVEEGLEELRVHRGHGQAYRCTPHIVRPIRDGSGPPVIRLV